MKFFVQQPPFYVGRELEKIFFERIKIVLFSGFIEMTKVTVVAISETETSHQQCKDLLTLSSRIGREQRSLYLTGKMYQMYPPPRDRRNQEKYINLLCNHLKKKGTLPV